MNHARFSLVLSLVITCTARAGLPADPAVQVFFSPRQGCIHAIQRELDRATRTIHCQSYVLTSPMVAASLCSAARRGVGVYVILDASMAKKNPEQIPALLAAGVTIATDAAEKINHNKVLIVDEAVVLTGSYNHSVSAEQANAENLVIIRDHLIAQSFCNDFKLHAVHSATLRSAPLPSPPPKPRPR